MTVVEVRVLGVAGDADAAGGHPDLGRACPRRPSCRPRGELRVPGITEHGADDLTVLRHDGLVRVDVHVGLDVVADREVPGVGRGAVPAVAVTHVGEAGNHRDLGPAAQKAVA